MTGAVSEQCVFVCCGKGANGKSTYLDATAYVLGDYARNLPFSALEYSAKASHPK